MQDVWDCFECIRSRPGDFFGVGNSFEAAPILFEVFCDCLGTTRGLLPFFFACSTFQYPNSTVHLFRCHALPVTPWIRSLAPTEKCFSQTISMFVWQPAISIPNRKHSKCLHHGPQHGTVTAEHKSTMTTPRQRNRSTQTRMCLSIAQTMPTSIPDGLRK